MQAINNKFAAFAQGNKQFIIPVFQRDYSWTTEQCQQLWDDVLRAGQGDGQGHFIGSFVYAEENTSAAFNTWLVIDGQQRLATLTLMLTALRDYIEEIEWEADEPTSAKIDAYFLKNTLEPGRRAYRLALRRHDDATLRGLLDRKDLTDVSDRSDFVIDAYEHFKTLFELDPEAITAIYRGISTLNIVDVKLHHHIDDPQLVFESLNSTGIDLTQSDLIRNFLLMGLPEPTQTRLYEEYWSKLEAIFRAAGSSPDTYLRDYIAFKTNVTSQPRADLTYSEFKEFWRDLDPASIEDNIADILQSGKRYAQFLKPSLISSVHIEQAIRNVRKLGTFHATLVTRLYECYENNTLTDDEFVKALNLIESYLVRRSVMRWQIRNYWSVFARLAHAVDDNRPFDTFQIALARENYRMPTDEEFKSALEKGDLYGLRVCAHVLSQLENSGYAEPSPTNDYSIEHIMPQKIDENPGWISMLGEGWEDTHRTWLHRLGNLTLTAYNSTYSNRPFEEKVKIEGGFKESAVRLNTDVRSQSIWTEKEMRARGKRLAKRALAIWPNHGADEKSIAEDKYRELRELANRVAFSDEGMRPEVQKLIKGLRKELLSIGECVAVVEKKSLCYYDRNANFYAEILPMSRYVRLLIPLEFHEVDDPSGIASDTTQWKVLPNVVHRDCGVCIDVRNEENISDAVALVRQAQQVVAT